MASPFPFFINLISCRPADARQLSVFLKDATQRAERHGYVQIPPPPTVPSPNVISSIAIISETDGPAVKRETPQASAPAPVTSVGPPASPN
jgi:hypothetical protein